MQPNQPTTTATIQATITSTSIVRAEAKCPFCDTVIEFNWIDNKLAKHVTCEHYRGRVTLEGNATGFRFGEAKPAGVMFDHPAVLRSVDNMGGVR